MEIHYGPCLLVTALWYGSLDFLYSFTPINYHVKYKVGVNVTKPFGASKIFERKNISFMQGRIWAMFL